MTDSERKKHSHKAKGDSRAKAIALLVVLGLVALVVALQANSDEDKNTSKTNGNNTSNTATVGANASLYLKPASQDVKAGSTVTLEVWVDAAGNPVNAVQANLTYPADKFDFNSIDAKGSGFEIQAEAKGGDGKVNIARGHIGDVKGTSLVAKVILVAKSDMGNVNVSFAEGSSVVRSSDHKDILNKKNGATLKITKLFSPIAVVQFKKAG